MDWNMLVTLWLLLSVVIFHKGILCGYATDEVRLRTDMFSGYETDVRPSETTAVTISLILLFLNKLDMSSQSMSVTAMWYTVWFDDRLAWDPANYSSISDIVISHKKVWKPSLIVRNEIEATGLIDKIEVPVRLFSDGFVLWMLPMTMNTMCEVNVQRYPFDTQTCNIDIFGVAYSTEEVDIWPAKQLPMNTKIYVQNGEWSYVSSSVGVHNDSDDVKTFRTLQFKLRFSRRWQFYSQYLLLPIMLNSVLMISVFLVPLESGEKLGFSLTVLLSYVVLLDMVTETLPPISTNISVLQVYLSVLMMIGTVSTLLTIWIISLYNIEETRRISPCLQKLTDYFLAPIACIRRNRQTTVKTYSPPPNDVRARTHMHCFNTTMMETERSGYRPEKRSSPKHVDMKDKVKTMSYREFALILDPFLFRLFALGLFIMTLNVTLFFFVYD